MAISNSSYVQNKYAAYASSELNGSNSAEQSNKNTKTTTENSNRIDDIKDTYSSTKNIYGNTIGNPKLSDEAASYYEELKKKYSNLNFVLVSSSQKEGALAKAAKYNNGTQITAVIDEEQIERMATDPEYRKKMEAYIDNAITQMDSLKNKLDEEGLSELISGLGVKLNDDGSVSFFAVLEEMSQAQRERIEEHIKESRDEAKQEAKEARNRERLKAYEDQMESAKDGKIKTGKNYYGNNSNNNSTVISASSIDELIEKLSAYKTEE